MPFAYHKCGGMGEGGVLVKTGARDCKECNRWLGGVGALDKVSYVYNGYI